jgi:hypothetical protein
MKERDCIKTAFPDAHCSQDEESGLYLILAFKGDYNGDENPVFGLGRTRPKAWAHAWRNIMEKIPVLEKAGERPKNVEFLNERRRM